MLSKHSISKLKQSRELAKDVLNGKGDVREKYREMSENFDYISMEVSCYAESEIKNSTDSYSGNYLECFLEKNYKNIEELDNKTEELDKLHEMYLSVFDIGSSTRYVQEEVMEKDCKDAINSINKILVSLENTQV